ncbi:alpha,alpha-trehalose-phosphate synthase (UDP-forming) [Halomicrobium salinisoli]|uniref:alpha,alpha-trehalose-phosphate synthase (UDP-forming) n=1 Tax=Halomicrobium salinisoli TaxID=2878391 RepID=UPI001CF031F6|nr:trehalose-6-phosphate synthase [Halomicrobium salinisoli]
MKWTNADDVQSGRGDPSATDGGSPDEGGDDVHGAISNLLQDRELIVVSNRQPYSHEYEDGEVVVEPPAGGLTAAVDPLMQRLSGTWVAWGDGEADREVADEDGTVALPPGEESYRLQRVWLDEDDVEGYYRGYSNRVLWPVCHADLSKVDARPGDWETYEAVNQTFADAVIRRTPGDGIVWFHDYHFGRAPRLVRNARPEAFLAQFWHIPWPSWDVFRACPQAEAILDGLLANDLVGFHTDTDCRHFLEGVEVAGLGDVDRTSGSVLRDGQRTYVRSFPIGTDAAKWAERAGSDAADEFWAEFSEENGLTDRRMALGVERLDYTKGIERRLDALELLWEEEPDLQGDLTYVQKVSMSRQEIPAYAELRERVEGRVAEINDRFGTDDWQPIHYVDDHLPREALAALYREADVALVTPTRDGMNLVAKEFVAAQGADPGVLVLSELAGASEQLDAGSVVVNPYDVRAVADGVRHALTVPREEREDRMERLRTDVEGNDVYAWLSAQFRTIDRIRDSREATDELLT